MIVVFVLFSRQTFVLFYFRIKKTETTLKILHDFEQGLENLRSWMDNVETNLQQPLSLNISNANELHGHQQSIAVREAFSIEK